MAILISPFSYTPKTSSLYISPKISNSKNGYNCNNYSSTHFGSTIFCSSQLKETFSTTPQPILIDKSCLSVYEAKSENELWAASSLRVRTFYAFHHDTLNTQDHTKYLTEREFEALTERIAGKRVGFGRVSCINATLPFSKVSNVAYDLSTSCKFSQDNSDLVVVGTLDINQCIRLPDEITGAKPKGIGADFARGYLSNVCVAGELQRNGLGYALISKAKMVAKDMGISDLYVHVAIDNEPARKLYMKCGFEQENEEPAWQARFLDRPRRLLLWTELSNSSDVSL
ncbi:GCN5-related N-acetyltransferase 7, chloroplastic [Lycium ferocissimum]|uniref:GCN5-related N-acetyltransferase 7, chloroplastic n=1 Tax=Lycium ferocissimum TaxID=112874 RepID=UPI0028157A65|nr:GCN5-related N-acetyltransferase 7, chloroplastic [Lycium ferocissimum]